MKQVDSDNGGDCRDIPPVHDCLVSPICLASRRVNIGLMGVVDRVRSSATGKRDFVKSSVQHRRHLNCNRPS